MINRDLSRFLGVVTVIMESLEAAIVAKQFDRIAVLCSDVELQVRRTIGPNAYSIVQMFNFTSSSYDSVVLDNNPAAVVFCNNN